MTGAMIFQLILALGPAALKLIPQLAETWNKEMSPAEVITLCAPAAKSYDEYLAAGKLAAATTVLTP